MPIIAMRRALELRLQTILIFSIVDLARKSPSTTKAASGLVSEMGEVLGLIFMSCHDTPPVVERKMLVVNVFLATTIRTHDQVLQRFTRCCSVLFPPCKKMTSAC